MENKKFNLNDAVTVFDQEGIITEVVDETREPYLYGVTFNDTQKMYVIESQHIEVKIDNRPVTERIKTFEDACRELGDKHPFVIQYNEIFDNFLDGAAESDSNDIIAYLKARIIVAALNEGWTPNFEENEWRYAPWYALLTNEEIEKLDEEEKQKVCRVVGRAGNHAYAYGGLVCAFAYNVSTSSYTSYGSRLAFKSKDLAEYAGKQFIEIFGVLAF